MENEKLIEQVKKNNRGNWFIQHIQEHLDNNDIGLNIQKIPKGVVGCCICGKTVDEIATETLNNIRKEIHKDL